MKYKYFNVNMTPNEARFALFSLAKSDVDKDEVLKEYEQIHKVIYKKHFEQTKDKMTAF